jgi:hypothetical protein
MLHVVKATEDKIKQILSFDNPVVEIILAKQSKDDPDVIGFCLYFHNCSAFTCQLGIFVDNVYVKDEFRGF